MQGLFSLILVFLSASNPHTLLTADTRVNSVLGKLPAADGGCCILWQQLKLALLAQ